MRILHACNIKTEDLIHHPQDKKTQNKSLFLCHLNGEALRVRAWHLNTLFFLPAPMVTLLLPDFSQRTVSLETYQIYPKFLVLIF